MIAAALLILLAVFAYGALVLLWDRTTERQRDRDAISPELWTAMRREKQRRKLALRRARESWKLSPELKDAITDEATHADD